MELIKALEQLSLQVRIRTNQADHSAIHQLNFADHSQASGINNHNDCSGKRSLNIPNVCGGNQLRDFDDSIGTLFTLIAGLDVSSERESKNIDRSSSVENSNTNRSVDTRRQIFAKPGSLDYGSAASSQEEDSDCSSQRNSYIDTIAFQAEEPSIVRDLLGRDLGTITYTVRKISRILFLGKKIQSIYSDYTIPSDTDEMVSNREMLCNDATLIESNEKTTANLIETCKTFLDLCYDDPLMMDLPTIMRYADVCHKLMAVLKQNKDAIRRSDSACMMETDESYQIGITSDCIQDDMPYVDDNAEEEPEEVLDFADGPLLSTRPSNWTENKLYVPDDQRFL